MLGSGIYTLGEASKLVGVSQRSARAWFTTGWPGSNSGPVLSSDYAKTGKDLLSFLDLVDLLVVGQLRGQHASMPSIRKAHNCLRHLLSSNHPFGRQELLADRKGKLFLQAANEAGESVLIEILKRQHVFPEVLLPYLERLEYDPATSLAMSYRVGDGVVIDARRHFGKPITEKNAMPTTILARAYKANNSDAEFVADWYGVTTVEVEYALQFESELSSAA